MKTPSVQTNAGKSPVVALVVPTFPTYSETFIVSKFLGLLERGWDVHIVSNRKSGDWDRFPELRERKDIDRRIHVAWPTKSRSIAATLLPVAIASTFARSPRSAAHYAAMAARDVGPSAVRRMYLDARLVALQPDIIHFEFGTIAIDRIQLRRYLGSRVIVSFRGYDLNYVGLDERNYYEPVWQSADALHLLGRDLWQRALRRGCPPQKSHGCIHPAVDASYFQSDPKGRLYSAGTIDRPLRIVSVGRLSWKKGYEYALQAIHNLKAAGCRCEYIIVGGGEFLEALAYARHQLGLEDIVTFAGAQSREFVRQAMVNADVFLHSAVSEGFCNAVLEAQAMELPVVTSDADGLGENVADGETGFVVPRRDPEALSRKLLLLASDSDLRARMGKAGRRRVVEHFQIEDQLDRFDSLYRAVLNQDSCKAGEIRLENQTADAPAVPVT